MTDYEKEKLLPFKNIYDLIDSVEKIKEAHERDNYAFKKMLISNNIPYTPLKGQLGGVYIDADKLTPKHISLITKRNEESGLLDKAYEELGVKFKKD